MTWLCPKCAARLSGKIRRCPDCGAPVPGKRLPDFNRPLRKSALLAGAISGICFWFYLAGGRRLLSSPYASDLWLTLVQQSLICVFAGSVLFAALVTILEYLKDIVTGQRVRLEDLPPVTSLTKRDHRSVSNGSVTDDMGIYDRDTHSTITSLDADSSIKSEYPRQTSQ